MYAPLWNSHARASQKVRIGNYERLFDEDDDESGRGESEPK